MAGKKVIFIAFAIEDEGQRNFLKGQSLNTNCPFEFVDMSVKEPYRSDWKERVRTRIRRSDGVIALVSKNSLSSSGQRWEIQCAKEEKIRLRGIWAYSDDRTNLDGVNTVVWSCGTTLQTSSIHFEWTAANAEGSRHRYRLLSAHHTAQRMRQRCAWRKSYARPPLRWIS